MSRPDTPDALAAIERAHARADADVAVGLSDLRALAATAPEWKVSANQQGARLIVPERQMLNGMLGHLEQSVAAARRRAAS